MATHTLPLRAPRGAFTDHAHITRKDGQLKMAKRFPKRSVPGTRVSLLSDASKMPSLSFSLPAGESCRHICGSCRVCWDAPDTAVSYHRH